MANPVALGAGFRRRRQFPPQMQLHQLPGGGIKGHYAGHGIAAQGDGVGLLLPAQRGQIAVRRNRQRLARGTGGFGEPLAVKMRQPG
ncbi:hypothetical protein D3C79_1020100 [compost metagenome]